MYYTWTVAEGLVVRHGEKPKKVPTGWTAVFNMKLLADLYYRTDEKKQYEEVKATLVKPLLQITQTNISGSISQGKSSQIPLIKSRTIEIPKPITEGIESSDITIELVRPKVEDQLPIVQKKSQVTFEMLPESVLLNALLYLDEPNLLNLRRVAKKIKKVADLAITRFIMRHATGFSSVMGPLDQYMKSQLSGATELLLSVDQITEKVFMDEILGGDVKRQINMGRSSKIGDVESEKSNNVKVISLTSGKMHNKFWVLDKKAVITGSPNLTPSAFKFNIESIVKLESRMVAGCFGLYFSIMRDSSGRSEKEAILRRMLATLNETDNSCFRLALSPYVNIQSFVLNCCKGASEIIIRMFLVSYSDRYADIVDGLGELSKQGTKIKIYVDDGQYEEAQDKSGYYVKEALRRLRSNGVEVFTQSRWKSGKMRIMHDKLLLVKFPQGYRTIIGSAGFSQNVMDNSNYENMVAIDGKELYDFFLTNHHEVTLSDSKEYKVWKIN